MIEDRVERMRVLVRAAVRKGRIAPERAGGLVQSYRLIARRREPEEYFTATTGVPATGLDEPEPPAAPTPAQTVRLRRLGAERDEMMAAFGDADSRIAVSEFEGDPPERYVLEYKVRGLARGAAGKIVIRSGHRVEVVLPADYPRLPPLCRMLTPAFHPNIDPQKICVGDHWSAGERLVDLCVRVGQLIAYQDFNIKSPLDGEAAKWADLNRAKLPVDASDLYPKR